MSNRSILVLAAHPDDEVLGCGATIARHARQGDQVHVVILAEGATSRDTQRVRESRASELSVLAQSAHIAREILGATSLTLHDLPDNRLDSIDLLDIVKMVEGHIQAVTPDTVYTHHSGDLNIDHRRIHEAVVTACRPQPGFPVETILFFEVSSSTEWQLPGSSQPFLPNWFVDVSDTIDLKLKALDSYNSEMRTWPHPRSQQAVENLARWRGSSVGFMAAEAFMTGRHLVKGRAV
jgi:LmbE family N-acetylglucosaminyl deacetylase